jgi:HNH endonuclease/NUMOD4 motif
MDPLFLNIINSDCNLALELSRIAEGQKMNQDKIIRLWNEFLEKGEYWSVIKEFPDYKVSNIGRVKNFKTGNFIADGSTAKCIYKRKYRTVKLNKNKGKTFKIFRLNILVASYFVPNPNENPVVDHLDGEKENNNSSNLEWVTYSENTRRWRERNHHKNEIEQYNREGILVRTWDAVKDITKELGYAEKSIRICCQGYRKTHKGFMWKYKYEKRETISEDDYKNNYVPIGTIKGWDFPSYKICKDGKKMANRFRKSVKNYSQEGYVTVHLYDSKKERHELCLHKIVNQVLLGGRYEDEINHIDGVRENSSPENLESVSHKENMDKRGKSLNQIDPKTGKIVKTFACISDAYKYFGKRVTGNIQSVCNGERKTAYGYKWEWTNDEDKIKERPVAKRNGKPVKKIDPESGETIATFSHVVDAYRSVGKCHSSFIQLVCNGKKKLAYGYKWEWGS